MSIPDCLKDGGTAPASTAGWATKTVWEVVTPLFLAGADAQDIQSEGLRCASLKGMLRWWWRATCAQSEVKDLAEHEGRLFGDTVHGQGCTIRSSSMKSFVSAPTINGSLGYLLGQGLYHHAKKTLRPAVNPGSCFSASLSNRLQSSELDRAWRAMSLLGGMGARSRRGFGSLAPAESPWTQPSDLHRDIQSFLASLPSASKTWSHLTPDSRFVVLPTAFDSWQSALTTLGDALLRFRQSLGGVTAPYGPDHDLVSDYLHKGRALPKAPLRAAFGIPHNYYFKSSKKQVQFLWEANDRRASPLHLHISKLNTGSYVAVAILFDGPFLPDGKQLKTKTRHARECRVPIPDYRAIHQFLDTLPAC